MNIKKSYHYYFIIISFNNFNPNVFFNQSHFDFIFNYKTPFLKYVEQGVCDILPNQYGILFTQTVLSQFNSNELINDFKSCFAFNLPTNICDKEQSRYKKNYTFEFNIEQMKKEISMELILHYEETEWKNILEINPDFFYLQNGKEILLASKDFKQVENWINQNQ